MMRALYGWLLFGAIVKLIEVCGLKGWQDTSVDSMTDDFVDGGRS